MTRAKLSLRVRVWTNDNNGPELMHGKVGFDSITEAVEWGRAQLRDNPSDPTDYFEIELVYDGETPGDVIYTEML